jgi:hypothetical protein
MPADLRAAAPPVALIRLAVAARGSATVLVEGDSMWPAIEAGTAVTVTGTPYAAVRTGQVVAVEHGGGLLVHRVAGRVGGRLLTLGDNLPLYDPPVDEAAYVGTVRAPAAGPREPRVPPGPRPGATGPVLWVFGPRQPPAPAGWQVRLRPRAGVGVAGPTVAELAGATRGGLRVGVSPYGALPLAALRAVYRLRPLHLLVGCPFGEVAGGPGRLLPPALAEVHVRAGEPAEPLDPATTVARLAAAFARWDADGQFEDEAREHGRNR